MAESNETAPSGSKIGRVIDKVKPGKNARHAIGVLLLIAVALGIVTVIVLGVMSSRTAYFQQSNLRELDRIAAELNTTSESLAQTATLHFVPRQLHFSLSRLECLIATTRIMGPRQQPILISYYFTDPTAMRDIARWYANLTPTTPAAGSPGPPILTSRPLPAGFCGYRRPLGLPTDTNEIELDNDRIFLARTASLTHLLWPMTPQRAPPAGEIASCVEEPDRLGAQQRVADIRAFIRRCFIAAALEDMADHSYSYRQPDRLRQAVEQSIDAALASNTIRINVSTNTSAMDLDAALEIFDAVQVIGTDDQGRPKMFLQAGHVPTAVEGDPAEQAQALRAILALSGQPAAATGANRNAPAAGAGREGDFLRETRVVRTGDLVLFQRTVPRLAGLPCTPCRIVGIVERSKFNHRVRKIEGLAATIFLIGLLSLIGLIPLVQLKLRKRLDATGRAGQYLVWFSLTLLAACAAVSFLAIWSAAASRNTGAIYAGTAIEQISVAFEQELADSLELIGRIGRDLGGSEAVFPAPHTLPGEDDLTDEGFYRPAPAARAELAVPEGRPGESPRPDSPPLPVITTLTESRVLEPNAAIIDTVGYIRGDGFIDRNTARVAVGRFPAFGTNIANRPYFVRARNREYNEMWLTCGDRPQPAASEFVLDRVFSRQDGALRTVFVLPAKRGCLREAEPPITTGLGAVRSAPQPAATAQRRPAAAVVPIYTEDQRTSYNPTRQEFVLATATMRTFLRTSLGPGFNYAVIDPHRERGEPNVLYHSLPGAELVERFEQEIDDPENFEALVRRALARPRPNAPSDQEAAGAAGHASALRMDSHYHAQPARLTVARLHDNLDWVLVIIEDRNDAGYAVWRAATFGYAVWFLSALILVLVLVIAHVRKDRSTDRRPGLWLWPRRRLESFTPPRLERKADLQARLGNAAGLRDRHMGWLFLAALIGIPAAEGTSRIVLGFAITAAALAARAYFQGLTTSDDKAGKRADRRVVWVAAALLLLAAITFYIAIDANYDLRNYLDPRRSWMDWPRRARIVVFWAAVAILARCLIGAHAHTRDTPPRMPDPENRAASFWYRLQSWKPRRPWPDAGWILALTVLGGVPASAGFLDSYDQDRFLLFERAQQVSRQAQEDRRQAIAAVNIARRAKLSEPFIEQAVIAPVTSEPLQPRLADGERAPPPDTDSCVTLSCIAMLYLDLRQQALEFSDFAPFNMGDAFNVRRGYWRPVALVITLLLPLVALVLILFFFRQQYFSAPPLLSPGKDPDFDPPLSLTREKFIDRALLEAAAGRTPDLPFAPAGGNRHLILGVGLDLRDDWIPGQSVRLGIMGSIRWIDLLDPPPGEPSDFAGDSSAVVIGNLDLALQDPDKERLERTYQIISAIAGSSGARTYGGRHVFLLADIDPLDRIALLWERQGKEGSGLVEGWRWAELIQDFTMFPIQAGKAVPHDLDEARVLRTIREELGALDTSFARELCDQLYATMRSALVLRPDLDTPVEADRITSFITEEMSDHYYKLWASSSDEERVILYRVARECHLKMKDSRALRSLLARGLLVRVPEYRLMNRSFGRYVTRIGETAPIRTTAASLGGIDWVWPLIRYPLAVIAGAAMLVLQFVAPSSANSAMGALPALLALVPAMLGRLFQERGAAN